MRTLFSSYRNQIYKTKRRSATLSATGGVTVAMRRIKAAAQEKPQFKRISRGIACGQLSSDIYGNFCIFKTKSGKTNL